jgi:dTDP-4-amino-4,6-dideoxygalactose transaminase
MHMQPLYRGHAFVTAAGKEGADTSVGADIFARGLCLPSDNKMTPDQQDAIIATIRESFEG